MLFDIKGVKPMVWQEANAYEKLVDDLDRAETKEAIRRGLEDIEAGRVKPIEQFFAEMEVRFPFLKEARQKRRPNALKGSAEDGNANSISNG